MINIKRKRQLGLSTFRTGCVVLVLLAIAAPGCDAPLRPEGGGASSPAAVTDIPEVTVVARDLMFEDGMRVQIEEGLLWAPENRNNPNSRKIPIPFIRIPAAAPTDSPRFYLPGGPGSYVKAYAGMEPQSLIAGFGIIKGVWGRKLIEAADGRADLIFLNQRGNSSLLMSSALVMPVSPTPLDTMDARASAAKTRANDLASAQEVARAAGYDLEGYDIIHLTDDLEALRKALGYERISLTANSFGSQWSLAYIRRYPEHVDRAVIDGVEPLDFAYDSPAALDRAIARVLDAADASPALTAYVPEGGYFEALKRVKAKLNKQPQKVRIELEEGDVDVTVSGVDVAGAVAGLRLEAGGASLQQRMARLPKFINEIDRGDYRFLGLIAYNARKGGFDDLNYFLIDNSLGISPARDAVLKQEASTAFVGDVNASYRATRSISATTTVNDEFRAFTRIDTPVMMVHGDFDFSTPIENAEAQYEWLNKGRMMIVHGASHQVHRELMAELPAAIDEMESFLRAEHNALPTGIVEVSLPPIEFSRVDGPSLFELAVQ